MVPNSTRLANRMVGRLFSDNGRLHMVLDVDMNAGVARVSYRNESGQQVADMPIAELSARLGSSGELKLDSLNSDTTSTRVTQRGSGWFFTTREGHQGPYPSASEAADALNQHVVAAQGTSVAGR